MNKERITLVAVLACVAAFALFTTSAFAAGVGKDGTIAAQKGKATTIAELVAMYDSTGCIDCHEETHDEWARSAHSRPVYGTGRTAATMKSALENGVLSWAFSGAEKPEDVEVEHLMGCAKCHLPQLADATDAVAKEFIGEIYSLMAAYRNDEMDKFEEIKDTLLSLNINCLVCHNRMAITHKWTDGYPQAGVVYGSVDGEHDDEAYPEMKISPIMSESILCGQCHGLGPNLELDNPTQCATAYGSYLWAYTAEGGKETCQECHMEKSGLGHDMQSYRSKVMSDAAVDFEVEAYGAKWRDGNLVSPKAIVAVKMTNRTGHAIPDGWPTPNRLVLSVSATDSEDDELYSEDKIYMPMPQKFARGDEMGRGPYEKSGIINDTGLPPGKTVEEHFEIPFYTEDVENDDGRVIERKLLDNELNIKVQLWYLPYGNKKSDPFLWQEFTKKVTVSE